MRITYSALLLFSGTLLAMDPTTEAKKCADLPAAAPQPVPASSPQASKAKPAAKPTASLPPTAARPRNPSGTPRRPDHLFM